ncbi:MAG: VanZ family protein [Woeseiaceae bacterium]|nr:VanZ family protein [Woeseiaceae bacterium]
MDERLLKRRIQIAISVSIAAVLLLVIQFGRPSPSGLWMSTLYESMHVLLFGLIALCVIVATPHHWKRRKRLAFMIGTVFALSLLSEAAQIPLDRDASMEDLIADWLGAAGFASIAIAFSNSFRMSGAVRKALAVGGIAVLTWALFPLAKVSAAYIERNQQMPELVNFDARFNSTFMRTQNVTLTRQSRSSSGGTSAHVLLEDGPWPGVLFHDLYPGWHDFEALVIELENPEATVLNLNVRVDDDEHRFGEQHYSDRYNLPFELQPGVETLRIPVSDIADAPAKRQMDLSSIDGIVVFGVRKDAGRTFIIHSIRLE